MKLRNIFTTLALAAFALMGCQKEEQRFLDEIQVSQSMVPLDVEGGSASITVTATAEWKFTETDSWPNIITRDKDGNIEKSEPTWLTIDKVSGGAGETVVTFSAEATTETREVFLRITSGEVSQLVNVVQMAEKIELPITPCETILSSAEVGKVYKVRGTITDLTNYDKYGCFYVNDGTGEVYVYGSMNPTQFKPETGDIITFEGPWTSYGNFDDVTILSLEKSMIKVEKVIPEGALPLDGGKLTVALTVKGEGLTIEIPEDAKSWLTAGEEASEVGTTTFVELTAAANEGGARNTTVTFKTLYKGEPYAAMVTVEQLGAIAEVTVAEFLEKEVGKSLFKLTGKVTKLKTGDYGNFHLEDATGSVYVYGLTATPVEKNDKSFPTLGIKEGDIVTLIGTRAQYAAASNEAEREQVGGPAYYVSHIGSTVVTVAEFLAKEVDSNVRYRLTGEITNLKTGDYGNFHLKDETGSVYVYGLTKAPVAKNDKSFPSLGLKEGDVVTLVGTRAQYAAASNETEKEQVGGPAYYISHVAGEGGGEDPEDPETPAEPTVATVAEFLAAAEDATVYELSGTISEITTAYSEQYGNISFKLTDETETVLIFRMSCEGIENPSAIAVGDKVTVQGTRSSYNNAPQMAAGSKCVSYTAGEQPETPAEPTVATVAEFLAAAEDATVYELSGTISEITTAYSEQYGNISFKLTDETETVAIFRMSCEGIENPSAIAVGDKVTVQGTRSSHNGTPQMAAGSKCISYTAFVSEASAWTIAGDFNSWNASATSLMTIALEDDLFVAKNLAIGSGSFKIVKNGNTWCGLKDQGQSIYADQYYTLQIGSGNNVGIVEHGTFDVYFDSANNRVALMTPGKPYSEATAGTPVTIIEGLEDHTWGVIGAFEGNDWGSDYAAMTKEGNYMVAKNVPLTANQEFKFRADGSWTLSYGSGCEVNVGTTYKTYVSGGNMKFVGEAGNYNLYFSLVDATFYMEEAVTVVEINSTHMKTAYPTTETDITVGDLTFGVYNVANYNNPASVQMKKGGSYIVSKSDAGKLKSIKITCHSSKTFYPSNTVLYVGETADAITTKITPTSDKTSSTFDLSAGNYKYFKLVNESNYAVYLESVKITVIEAAEDNGGSSSLPIEDWQ